ncbi:NADPH:quinone reductase [Candidatus Pantoea varia]|uniref:NADPH:quinone reductase n=1 Tax=Candidatus Pantoea varia TaxID=1881036 RepID=A0A1I5EG29_9GAMM|nr:NADP-dependent oxidoreductase [Pantoea varia]SFO10435.1 NADPH:quinone reductase [Pantoea varia]
MKAVLLKSYGDIDQFIVGDVPKPVPQAGEVLIKIETSAVNPFDLILRQGFMAQFIPLELPAIPGGDAAGTITAVGAGVIRLKVGDRVVGDFPANGKGAHAEYGVLPETSVTKLPDNLSFEQGASLVKAGLTGRQTVDALPIKTGDRVLVSGGLGMVGRVAIQFLREIGAKPVAGVRPERIESALLLAGEAIDITKMPDTAGFDFAISTAYSVAKNLIAHVRNGGHIASIVQIPDGINNDQRVFIHELFHQTDMDTMNDVLGAASRGELVIPVAKILGLEEIGEAHRMVEKGVQGKILLK